MKRTIGVFVAVTMTLSGLAVMSSASTASAESESLEQQVQAAFMTIGGSVARGSGSMSQVVADAEALRMTLPSTAGTSAVSTAHTNAMNAPVTWASVYDSLVEGWTAAVPADVDLTGESAEAARLVGAYNTLVAGSEFAEMRASMLSSLADPAVRDAFLALDGLAVAVPASFPPNPLRLVELVLRNVGNTTSFALKTVANVGVLAGAVLLLVGGGLGCSSLVGGGPLGAVAAVVCVIALLESGLATVVLNRLGNLIDDSLTYGSQVQSALNDFVSGTLDDLADAQRVGQALGQCSGLVSIPERMAYCIQLVIECPECYSFAVTSSDRPRLALAS